MDPYRFDSIAKYFSGRFSRRGVLRGGGCGPLRQDFAAGSFVPRPGGTGDHTGTLRGVPSAPV